MAVFDLKNKACIVGVGTSEKFGFVVNKSPIMLQLEAFKAALEDAGLKREDIDGFATAHGAPTGVDYDAFAVQAGCNFRWVNQNWNHGRWAATSITFAAMAVCAGLCDYVAVCNTTLSARGYGRFLPRERFGGEGFRDAGGGHGETPYHGMDTPGSAVSMIARKYNLKYGATSEELGAVSVAFRKHASLNPMAIMRDRVTLDDYLNSRMISDPFHLLDYCLVNEGSTCLILTTADRAKNLRKPPAYIAGAQGIPASRNGYVIYARPGIGVSMTGEFDWQPEPQPVFGMAGVSQKDIDALYTYDSFSQNVYHTLERFGFCPPGEAHTWIQGGRIELGGELPMNTNGGLLSEGHYSGYNQIIEMVRQLRRECGERQVKDAEVLQWAASWGDSMVLTRG